MRRIVLVLVLLLGTLLIPATAFAQDECTGILDPEEGIMLASKEAMAALSTYATEAGMSFSLVNGPSLPKELSASMDFDGQFAVDPALTARLMEYQEMDAADMADSVGDLMEIIVELYQTVAFTMDLNLGVSTDLGNMIAASSGLASFPSSISLPTRMSEGFMYFNMDNVAEQFEVPEEVQGWFAIDYGTLMADSVDQMMTALEEGSGSDDTLAASMASMGSMMALQKSAQQYVTIVANGTDEVDGVEVCEVVSTYDLAGFLSDPAFIEMMVDQMTMQIEMQAAEGSEEIAMTEQDIEMVAQMLPMLAPMLLSGLELESTQLIGVEDYLVYSSDALLEWDMASLANMLGAMMAQSGEASPLDPDNPPYLAISVASNNSAFDEEFEVEVPDPVTIIPLEALQEAE